ncbi:lytic transglycosylase domain-containing protein [Pectobacterium brasiliense]|uniref:lytic transglycosylase domain-containing protein n=1 Tax=Pectobacterium brasiliense TaxID=180957 RepID=UPI000B964422|nr:lytic transglycosylase domain-containing protein [Pectobacterium carotovorum]OYN49465.1 hypothetical protein B7L51_19555 [Pectobacterium carotovorum]
MATIIDSLVVTLGLDSSGFKKGQSEVKKGLDDTRKGADQTAKDMEAAGKRAASFFGSIRTELLALVGVTLSAQGIKTFITNMTSDLMRLGIESRSLDMSAKSLDGWERAAAAAGSTAERMSGALASFQSTLTKIRTGGAQGDPLFGTLANFGAATGANFDYDNDNSEAIMRKIASNWGRLSKDAQRRFGSEFGFDNATQQGLASGSLVRDADHFTKISKATDEATKKALEFNRRLEEMKQNFSAAAQVLYEALIPYVEKLIPLIEKLGIWISTHGPEIEKFFSDSAVEINKVVDSVGGWQNALEILLAFMVGKWSLGMLASIDKVSKGFGPLITAIAAVSAWDKIATTKDDAKNQGVSIGEYLVNRSQKKESDKDSPKNRFFNWIAGLEKPDTYYDAYGTMPKGGVSKLSEKGNALLGFMSSQFASLEAKYSLPDGILRSIAATESGGNKFAISSAGAKGLFQFMDGTAKDMGLSGGDVFDPSKSASAAAKYLRQLLNSTGGDIVQALGAYNWGIGNVQKKGLMNAPDETLNYIPKVMGGIQVGAASSAMRGGNHGSYGSGSKTEINIGEVNMNTSANNTNALGADIQRNVQRNRLVTPAMSGQG